MATMRDSLRKLAEVAKPVPGDEQEFVAKHVIKTFDLQGKDSISQETPYELILKNVAAVRAPGQPGKEDHGHDAPGESERAYNIPESREDKIAFLTAMMEETIDPKELQLEEDEGELLADESLFETTFSKRRKQPRGVELHYKPPEWHPLKRPFKITHFSAQDAERGRREYEKMGYRLVHKKLVYEAHDRIARAIWGGSGVKEYWTKVAKRHQTDAEHATTATQRNYARRMYKRAMSASEMSSHPKAHNYYVTGVRELGEGFQHVEEATEKEAPYHALFVPKAGAKLRDHLAFPLHTTSEDDAHKAFERTFGKKMKADYTLHGIVPAKVNEEAEQVTEGKVSGYKMYRNPDNTFYVEDEDEGVVLRNASQGEAEHMVWSGNQKLKGVVNAQPAARKTIKKRMKEEAEQLDEIGDTARGRGFLAKKYLPAAAKRLAASSRLHGAYRDSVGDSADEYERQEREELTKKFGQRAGVRQKGIARAGARIADQGYSKPSKKG